LTTFWRQLFSVINWEIIDNFLYDAGKIMKKENKDIIVSLHEIKNIDTSSGQINYNRNDLLLQN
jgi:hypothetical protein